MASSTPGYCTLTATARPSRVIARWTWPMDADASGAGSHSRKMSSGWAPSSRSMTPAASSADMGGASCCRPARASRAWSGRPTSRYEAICPSFMKAPFMPPRASATCSAVRSSNCWSSSAWRSAEANTRRARWTAKPAPARPPRRASSARRWLRVRNRRPPASSSPGPGAVAARRRRAAIAAAPAAAAMPAASAFVPLRATSGAYRAVTVGRPSRVGRERGITSPGSPDRGARRTRPRPRWRRAWSCSAPAPGLRRAGPWCDPRRGTG